jgi:hypothetical protein
MLVFTIVSALLKALLVFRLPLCSIIGKKVMVVHGGLFSEVRFISD